MEQLDQIIAAGGERYLLRSRCYEVLACCHSATQVGRGDLPGIYPAVGDGQFVVNGGVLGVRDSVVALGAMLPSEMPFWLVEALEGA